MKKVCFLVCSNGLGHLRRVLQILHKLEPNFKNFKFDVFSDNEKRKYLKNWKIFEKVSKKDNINFYDFKPYPRWLANLSDFDFKLLFSWHKNLNFLSSYDIVISDNFIEPLLYNKKTIISGSFLWHDIYFDRYKDKREIKEYYSFCKELLEKFKPYMIVNKYFYYQSLKNEAKLIKIGMLKSIKKDAPKKKDGKIGILLSFSAAENIINHLKDFKFKNNEIKIYYDKRTGEKISFKNFKAFSYEKDSFSKIDAIIGFAGMGIITESVGTSTPIFCLPSENPEILHNSKVLESLGLGKIVSSVDDAISNITQFYLSKKNYKKYLKNLKNIDKNGIVQTVDFISKFIKEN